MNNAILLFVSLFLLNAISLAQTSDEKIMFVIDSIPVLEDPEDGNEVSQTDVADLTVVKNKDSLRSWGYQKFDGVTFLFTKEYRNRPDSLKRIPSTKQLEQKNGVWLLLNSPFTGRFVDYYYSGRKKSEGRFLNGKLDGQSRLYSQSGEVLLERAYREGVAEGRDTEFYTDGSLKQSGVYVNGKEEGVWESYYPNGQVKLRSKYKGGELVDTATKYYSTGRVKERVQIKNDNVIPDPGLRKINQLMIRSQESNKAGDTRSAINHCSKVIEIDSTYAEAYFTRGTIKLNEFKFDEAIADFDKALVFEPFMETALSNRAFARIRRYQFSGAKKLSQNTEVTVLAAKDKFPIPQVDQEKICTDLQPALFLGQKTKMMLEAVSQYCQAKSIN